MYWLDRIGWGFSRGGRLALLAAAAVLFGWSNNVRAVCPTTAAASTVWQGDYDGCVIRPEHSTSGAYTIACAEEGMGLNDVWAYSFNASHVGQTFAVAQVYSTNLHAVDAIGVDDSGSPRLSIGWQGFNPYWSRPFLQWRQLDTNLSSPFAEDFIADPTANAYMTRWGHSFETLPFSGRVVNVVSMLQSVPANACEPAKKHTEWRAVINMFESDMTPITGIPNNLPVSSTCSYSLQHQGSAGWGQEMPDVASSWFFGDFFVVTWHDRVDCKIYARLFNVNGTPIAQNIVVDDLLGAGCGSDRVLSPRVTAFSTGFVVTWTRYDGSLWMRTFDTWGSPYINPMLVTYTTNVKGGVDIDGVSATLCPGADYRAYYAITWWAYYPQPGGTASLYPQTIVMQDLLNPQPLYSGWGYYGFDSLAQREISPLTGEALWDRPSVEFFDRSCNDLTMGLAWSVEDEVSSQYAQVRQATLRFVPVCESTLRGGEQIEGPTSLADGARLHPGGTDPSCAPGSCFAFEPSTRPKGEPVMVFPPSKDKE